MNQIETVENEFIAYPKNQPKNNNDEQFLCPHCKKFN